MCAPLTAVKEIYAVGCRRRQLQYESTYGPRCHAVQLWKLQAHWLPERSLRTLLSCFYDACIALEEDRAVNGPQGTPAFYEDPWLPAAIIMLQLCI